MPKRRRWGSVRRLPSGRYQARYPGPDGTLHPAPHTFATNTDADIWLTDKEAEMRREGWQDPYAGRELLGDYAERWVKERDLAPKTRALYEGLLTRHIGPQLGQVELRQLTPPMVRRWRQGRLDAGVGATTVAKAYRLLKAVMTTAADEDEVIRRNPCRIAGAGQEKAPERTLLTIGDLYRIAGAIKPWWRVMVLTAGLLGLRLSELRGLERRDIDLRGRKLYVRRAVVEVEGRMVEGPPKSTAGERSVAIPEPLVPELKRQLDERAQAGPLGKVFVGPKGAPPRSANLTPVWRAACTEAGVPATVTFHVLRHLANTLVGGASGSLRDQMVWMGHASTRAALIYQHTDDDIQTAIADAIASQVRQWHADGTALDDNGTGEVEIPESG